MIPLEIRTNNNALDLYKGTEDKFSVTRQIHDLRNLQTRNSSYTNAFNVPNTPRNLDMLGVSSFIGSRKQNPKQDCQILMNGVNIAVRARLTASYNGTDIDIQIYFGNFNFYDALEGLLSDLDWSSQDLTWDVSGIDAIATDNDDIVPGMASYFHPEGLVNINASAVWKAEIDINFIGFHLYLRETLKKVVTQNGYTLNEDPYIAAHKVGSIANLIYNRAAICCPVTKFVEISQEGSPIFASVKSTGSQQESGIDVYRIKMDTVVSDASGLFDLATEQFDFVSERTLDVRLQVAGTFADPSGLGVPIIFIIKKNDGIVARYALFVDGSFDLNILAKTPVINGDEIHGELWINSANQVVVIDTDAKFSAIEPATDTARGIFIRDHIPEIKQRDFLAWMVAINNMLIDVDENTRIVKIMPYNDFLSNEDQNFSKNIDESKEQKISSEGFKHFQNNILRYAENKDLRRTDADTIYNFPNQTLAKEGDFVTVGFGASDQATLGGEITDNQGHEYPLYEMESSLEAGLSHAGGGGDGTFTLSPGLDFKPGDYIDSAAQGSKKIISKSSDTAGICQGTWGGNFGPVDFHWRRFKIGKLTPPRIAYMSAATSTPKLHDGDSLNMTTTTDPLYATFNERLQWGHIVEKEYLNLLKALETPMILRIWAKFTVTEFIAIDFLRPVYLEKYKTKFYLNKINQYKVNGLCQLELIRI